MGQPIAIQVMGSPLLEPTFGALVRGTWTCTYSCAWWMIPKGDDLGSAQPMLEKITDDQGREVEYFFDNTGRLHEVRVVTSPTCTL